MSLDEGIPVEDLRQAKAATDPDLGADKAGWHGIVALVKDHMMIGVNGAFLPQRHFKSRSRKFLEKRFLVPLETKHGSLMGRSVGAESYLFTAPNKRLLVGFSHVNICP